MTRAEMVAALARADAAVRRIPIHDDDVDAERERTAALADMAAVCRALSLWREPLR